MVVVAAAAAAVVVVVIVVVVVVVVVISDWPQRPTCTGRHTKGRLLGVSGAWAKCLVWQNRVLIQREAKTMIVPQVSSCNSGHLRM